MNSLLAALAPRATNAAAPPAARNRLREVILNPPSPCQSSIHRRAVDVAAGARGQRQFREVLSCSFPEIALLNELDHQVACRSSVRFQAGSEPGLAVGVRWPL